MKVFLVLLVVVALFVGGFFAYMKIATSSPSPTPNLEVTLEGTLTSVTPTSEYSFVLKNKTGTVGINSMKVDLSQYNNKKVIMKGQYSGSVLYADSVTINQ